MRTQIFQRSQSFPALHNYPIARTNLFICCVALKENVLCRGEGWRFVCRALDGCHFERRFSIKCQLLNPEVETQYLYFLSRSPHPQGCTKQQAATPPTNSLTLIVFMSPWKCPQISDLSKLFCLYNPLCTTWPRSIPTASSSSL